MKRHTPLFAIVASLPFAATLAAQQTIMVPQNAPTIEAAIVLANDGDRILLTQSAYTVSAAGLVVAKSLTIEADGSSQATITYPNAIGLATATEPALRITGLGGLGRVVLRNLTLRGGYSSYASSVQRSAVLAVQVPNQVGEVVLEGVRAFGEMRHSHEGCPGLRLECGPGTAILIRACRFVGATGVSPISAPGDRDYDGSPGLVGDVAGTMLAECSWFEGGNGGWNQWSFLGPFGPGLRGGDAVRLTAPRSAFKECEMVEGRPGPAVASHPPLFGTPDPCASYGPSGQFVTTAQLFDCVKASVAPGCNQAVQLSSLQPGRNDIECVPTATPGLPFLFRVRAVQSGVGVTVLTVAARVATVNVPGIHGDMYLDNPALLGFVPPSTSASWTDIWVPGPPPLPGMPTIGLQPIHLDAQGLRFGSFATFTIR
jgi:hypothetical protein